MNFVKVGLVEYEVVFKFDTLYCGWECDPHGYVVKTPEGLRLVHSNHGIKYFAQQAEFLDFIEDYKKVIEDTTKAIGMVNNDV